MASKLNSIITHALKLANLTPRQSYVIARRMDGLKHREIAEELGVSQQYVAKSIVIALRKIRVVMPRFNANSNNHFEIINEANK
jgi:DNA-directed RNA polymerase specialized sigma24 family protein